jgi:hypothetical protein
MLLVRYLGQQQQQQQQQTGSVCIQHI